MASAALDLSAPVSEANFNPGRSAERLSVLLPGKLTIFDGHYDCAIEDVSQTGARLIADVPLKIGQQGIMKCHPLDELFRVVWTDGKTAGIRFDTKVALGLVRTLRWHNDRYRKRHDAELSEIVQDWAAGTRR